MSWNVERYAILVVEFLGPSRSGTGIAFACAVRLHTKEESHGGKFEAIEFEI